MARPKKLEGKTETEKKKIKDDFEKLCALQCTEPEVCAFFDVTDKTLARWCKETYGRSFSEVFKEKRKLGHISLRRSQFKLAEKSAAMAIFLGKNWLGQKDAPVEVTHTASPIDQITEQIFKLQKEQAVQAEAQDADTDADS